MRLVLQTSRLPPAQRQHLPYLLLIRGSLAYIAGGRGSNPTAVTALTFNPSMKTARSSGEYQTPTPAQLINDADIDIPVGFASRLWLKRLSDDIQRRIVGILKQPPSIGWNDLPQELVDEILGYLLDDSPALQACSLTCKRLLFTTRPLIHRRLVCSDSRPENLKPERWLFSRRKEVIPREPLSG